MTEEIPISRKLLAWNGVELYIPVTWEVRFTKNQHIVFEKDFTPQLQLRWEQVKKPNFKHLQKKLLQFSTESEIISDSERFPDWLPVQEKFGLLLLAAGRDKRVTSGIFGCLHCKIIFFFQILDVTPAVSAETVSSLESLHCHDNSDTLWQFQDFSFNTPSGFTLQNYSFGAGLTRLSFKGSKLVCHSCRLGPAEQRLETQSLDNILQALVDAKEVSVVMQEDEKSCALRRKPSIPKQIIYRLRREHPFIFAQIWHDEPNNLLLAVVSTSKQPITFDLTNFFNFT